MFLLFDNFVTCHYLLVTILSAQQLIGFVHPEPENKRCVRSAPTSPKIYCLTGESDIDVAIIIRGLTRELKHQILDRVAEVELNHLMPVSALLFSEEEFNRLKKRERRIALDIEGEGIPL